MEKVAENDCILVQLDDEVNRLEFVVKNLMSIQYMATEVSNLEPTAWFVPIDYLVDLQKEIRLHVDQLFEIEKQRRRTNNGTN